MADIYTITTPLSILLTGMQTLALIYCGTMYLINAKKREKSEKNLLIYGFGFYFLFHASSLFLWSFLNRFTLVLTYSDGMFLGNLDYPATELYYIFDKIAFIIDFLAFSAIILPFERIVKKTKYSLTLMNVIVIIVILVLPYDRSVNEFFFEFIQVIGIVFLTIDMALFLFIMVLLSKWSRLEFKAIAVIIIHGIALIMVGTLFINESILSLNLIPLFVSPTLIILGSLICVSPFVLNPRTFSSALAYWYILGFLVGSLLFGIMIFSLFFLAIEFIIMNVIITILVIMMVFYMIKDIKSQQAVDLGMGEVERKTPPIKVLEIFTRPQRITEEEVSISKERKVCLVCKGKVGGFNAFICTDCGVLYCENCARILSDQENMCWFCNAPFDDSKPSKPCEPKEEEIAIQESEKKKKKEESEVKF